MDFGSCSVAAYNTSFLPCGTGSPHGLALNQVAAGATGFCTDARNTCAFSTSGLGITCPRSDRRCWPSRPDLCWWWPSRLVATATSANCLTLNYYRLAIGTSRQVLMVGEWGTLLPVLRCPARLFATAIEGLILPEPPETAGASDRG